MLKNSAFVRGSCVVVGAAFLAGCSPAMQAGTALSAAAALPQVLQTINTAVSISNKLDAGIEAACQDYGNVAKLADALANRGILPVSIVAKVRSIEGYGDPVCSGAPHDPITTAEWLGGLAANVAEIVKPADAP